MIESADFTIKAWSHVVDFVVDPPKPADPVEALKATRRGDTPPTFTVPLVFAGIYTGPIRLTIGVLDHEPDTIAPGWEDVLEVSLAIPEGNVYFNQPTGADTHEVGSISAADAGSYRVRLHASGRDSDYDLVVETSAERHLVQFWKAPPANTIVLANASSAGKSLPRFVAMWQSGLSGPATSVGYTGRTASAGQHTGRDRR
ncbi:hypothetical protein [Arthrobacter sp. 92]|uniref:hypothetical protein n=1 Tax=Arthrobacter sp. 92 TaxID=3418175 RepID=UPI003D01BB38